MPCKSKEKEKTSHELERTDVRTGYLYTYYKTGRLTVGEERGRNYWGKPIGGSGDEGCFTSHTYIVYIRIRTHKMWSIYGQAFATM